MEQIDHAAYQKKVGTLTDHALWFTIADARAAMEAMPNGEKAGYYADEVHYAAMELERRRRERK
jgi:hypothetical protein